MADTTISQLDPASSISITDVLPISNGTQTLKATVSQLRGSSGAITGFIIMWPLATAPSGYLECDGSIISRTTYSALFAVLGTTYGVGDGTTTFKLPDYRGRFMRGWDHGAGVDPDKAARTDRGDGTTGDAVGTKQADEFKSHTHLGSVSRYYIGNNGSYGWVSPPNQDVTTTATGGNETRPININIMFCIKT